MSKSTKPREFWIIESPDGKESDYVYRHNPFPTDGGAVHVREVMPGDKSPAVNSAMEKFWERRDQLKCQELDRVTRALEKAKEYLAKIAYWKSDANVCCFPIDFDKSEKEIEAIERGEK